MQHVDIHPWVRLYWGEDQRGGEKNHPALDACFWTGLLCKNLSQSAFFYCILGNVLNPPVGLNVNQNYVYPFWTNIVLNGSLYKLSTHKAFTPQSVRPQRFPLLSVPTAKPFLPQNVSSIVHWYKSSLKQSILYLW